MENEIGSELGLDDFQHAGPAQVPVAPAKLTVGRACSATLRALEVPTNPRPAPSPAARGTALPAIKLHAAHQRYC